MKKENTKYNNPSILTEEYIVCRRWRDTVLKGEYMDEQPWPSLRQKKSAMKINAKARHLPFKYLGIIQFYLNKVVKNKKPDLLKTLFKIDTIFASSELKSVKFTPSK